MKKFHSDFEDNEFEDDFDDDLEDYEDEIDLDS
ncbi:MAG: hypothetical protein NPMRTHETA2_410006 [Nitrosopumilales archaeon]|nr:MAG: hypothetical protein NPMRTHETA2_410006 [Nitrosopumilales archaeon]